MLLVIDVSNSTTTLGTFQGKKLKGIYRITTKVPRTSDEYGVLLCDLLDLTNADHRDIELVATHDAPVVEAMAQGYHRSVYPR
jgi:type III pantothenate kinase